jgi:hypothetical protein
LLINSALFFLDHVLIKKEKRKYRLLAFQNSRKLIDKTFKSMRKARIFFSKSFSNRRYKSTVAEWSKLYQPDPGWLEEIGNPINVFPYINTITEDLNV